MKTLIDFFMIVTHSILALLCVYMMLVLVRNLLFS